MAMLLETKRLIIFTVSMPEFDKDVKTQIMPNGIFLKPAGVTAERLLKESKSITLLKECVGLISVGQNGWIDYVIEPEYRNKGYATEALEVVKNFTIQNKVEPFLQINHDNLASLAVARKCGFNHVAHQNGVYARYYAT